MRKTGKISQAKQAKTSLQGIPSLAFIRSNEKITAPTPVKLYPTLRQWARQHGGSTFIRSLIEQAKLKEENGKEEE